MDILALCKRLFHLVLRRQRCELKAFRVIAVDIPTKKDPSPTALIIG